MRGKILKIFHKADDNRGGGGLFWVFSWFLCIVPRSFSSFFSYFLFLCILQGIKTQDRATIVLLFLFFKILCFNIFYVFFFYHFSKGVEIKLFSANFFSWNILGYKEEEKRKQVRHFLMPDMKFFFFSNYPTEKVARTLSWTKNNPRFELP